MASTLKDLERRLAQVEQEVVRLRQLVEGAVAEETATQRGARLLREAKSSQAEITATTARIFEEMGITGDPVGPARLREMMESCGVKAEENTFSSEIIKMRDE